MTTTDVPVGMTAVVTGGADGIGRGIAERFLADGARVVVADLADGAGEGWLDALDEEQKSRAAFVHADVSRSIDVEKIFETAIEEFGRLDVLVNNAAIAHGPAAERHFLDTDEAMWDRLMAVNLKSVYLCSARASRIMVEQRRGGSIITVSSAGGTRAHRHRVAYDATKGAIEAATRALALDLAPFGIRVNAVAPGSIAVARRTPVGDEGATGPEHVIPLARQGTPADVAAAVAFLASDDAAYITGICLAIDGGLLAQLRSPAVDIKPSPVTTEEHIP
jgi:3-oxoacyl-[acyl-carrier protein] reductase